MVAIVCVSCAARNFFSKKCFGLHGDVQIIFNLFFCLCYNFIIYFVFFSNCKILPPLFAASISAIWKTVTGQSLGTQLTESPITENTMVGFFLPLMNVFLIFSHIVFANLQKKNDTVYRKLSTNPNFHSCTSTYTQDEINSMTFIVIGIVTKK